MFIKSNVISLVKDLDKLSIKSASHKYLEVLARVFDDWASVDDDFRYNEESHKVVSRSNFFNHFNGFLTSSIGSSNVPSKILTSEQRLELIPQIETLLLLFENTYSRIEHSLDIEENLILVRSEFFDEMFSHYFKISSRNDGFIHSPEVVTLDEWLIGIISEVISASVLESELLKILSTDFFTSC